MEESESEGGAVRGEGGESRLFPSSKNLIDKIIMNSSTKHPAVFLRGLPWELFEDGEGEEGPRVIGVPGQWVPQTALTHLGLGRWLETRQADGGCHLWPSGQGVWGSVGRRQAGAWLTRRLQEEGLGPWCGL